MLGVLLLLATTPVVEPSASPAAETPPTDPALPPTSTEASETEQPIANDGDRVRLLEARLAVQEQHIAQQNERIARLEGAAETTVQPVSERPHVESPPPPAADQTQRGDPLVTLVSKDFPRSIPMFGSDFRFALSGYVKLDVIYDFDGHPDRYRFTLAGIPKEGDPVRAGYLSIHARETRLKFDVRYGGAGAPPNQALVEIDFFTPSSDFAAPRLRHAYLRWGDFLAGQTWSLLTDLRPLPFIIDFAFSDSVNATRVPQLRYQSFVTDFLVVRAGIEMPELGGVDNPEAAVGAVSPRLPRAAVGASLEAKRGFVSGGFSLGEIRWDIDDTTSDPTTLAWMAVLNARYLLDREGRAFVGAHGSIGEGTGELVGALSGQNSNATLAGGSLVPMLSGHGMIGAGYRLAPAISTNAALAWDLLVPSPERSPDALEWARSVHVNVVGHISEPLQIGLEAMFGESENVDGSVGRGTRLEGMAMYSF